MRRTSSLDHLRLLTLLSVAGGVALVGMSPVAADDPPPSIPPGPSAPAAGPDTEDENAEREVLVVLKSGQRIQGILAKATDRTVEVKVSGITASFPISDVERYEFLPPLMERYRQLRMAVGEDPNQIADLAMWLRERGKYELALSEVDRALVINPEHVDCLRLKLELEQQILLRMQAKKGPKPAPAANPGDIPGGGEVNPRRSRIQDFPVLNSAQIELMKVFEVDLSEKPRVVIPREAMIRLMEENVGHPLIPQAKEGRDALLRQSPTEQLDLIFRLQARDLYSQIQVLDMPGAVRKFREDVHTTWLNSCATLMCHGGSDAGRFVLATRRPNHDQTVYTNLYILQKYRTNDGESLIDWENPEKSPLFQLALPREDSLRPHPHAPLGAAGRDGWKPAFRDTSEKMFKESVDWVRSMYKPRPDYKIPYVPVKPFEPPPLTPAVPKVAPVPPSGNGPAPAPGSGAAAPNGAGGTGTCGGGGGGQGEPPPR